MTRGVDTRWGERLGRVATLRGQCLGEESAGTPCVGWFPTVVVAARAGAGHALGRARVEPGCPPETWHSTSRCTHEKVREHAKLLSTRRCMGGTTGLECDSPRFIHPSPLPRSAAAGAVVVRSS